MLESRTLQVNQPSTVLWEDRKCTTIGTELLRGETFTQYGGQGDLYFGTAFDGYQGYVSSDHLSLSIYPVTHRVCKPVAGVYSAPEARSKLVALIPYNARVAVGGISQNGFVTVEDGWMLAHVLTPLAIPTRDWVHEIEMLVGLPYAWGRRAFSYDCSALTHAGGIARGALLKRNAIDQRNHGLPTPSHLGRGDLVFWEGHVGVMRDAYMLIHACGKAMQVRVENLQSVIRARGPYDLARRL